MTPTSRSASAVRLLIVDDHTLFREGLAAMARAVGHLKATACGRDEAAAQARELKAHVAAVGMGLLPQQALDTATQVLGVSPDTRLLMLDDRVRPANLKAALAAGASGYWTKHISFEEFLLAVRAVAAGDWSCCRAAARHLEDTTSGPRLKPSAERLNVADLTRREHEVFLLLAGGLSVKQCAARLDLSANTIDNHKTRLMKKLAVHRIADLVLIAVREGLLDV